jgi:hypothetical protein
MAREYLNTTINHICDRPENPAIADLNLVLTSSVIIDDEVDQGIIRVAENIGNSEGVEAFGGCDLIAMKTSPASHHASYQITKQLC